MGMGDRLIKRGFTSRRHVADRKLAQIHIRFRRCGEWIWLLREETLWERLGLTPS